MKQQSEFAKRTEEIARQDVLWFWAVHAPHVKTWEKVLKVYVKSSYCGAEAKYTLENGELTRYADDFQHGSHNVLDVYESILNECLDINGEYIDTHIGQIISSRLSPWDDEYPIDVQNEVKKLLLQKL